MKPSSDLSSGQGEGALSGQSSGTTWADHMLDVLLPACQGEMIRVRIYE